MLRSLLWLLLGLALLSWLIGGFLISVSGRWECDGRLITLKQFGPWVWGICQVPGGDQRYHGTIFWGQLRLTRRDYGSQHLKGLGFNSEQATAVSGTVMVRLRLRKSGANLKGSLRGTRFQFQSGSARITSMTMTGAEPRVWQRA